MRLPLLFCFVVASAAACGGSGEPAKPTPVAPTVPVVTTVTILPGVAQVEIGATVPLTAEVRDQTGALITGKTPSWTSSNPAIASIDASSGLLRGVAVGSVTLTATVDGKSGTSLANVIPLAVTSVSIAAPAAAMLPGQTLPLVLTLKDRNGGVLTGRFVAWTSSATRIATVDANGIVTALSAGTTTITALSEQVSATVTIVVDVPAGTVAPSISAISPATLTPGASATIAGANFVPGATNTAVYVAGLQVTVNAATTTQLSVTLPAAGLPCQTTQPVNVEVTTVSGTATAKQPLSVATPRALAVGASFMATATGGIGCNELPASGTYVISVFNAGQTLNASAGFELKGVPGGVIASKLAPTDALHSVNVIAAPAPVRSGVDPAVAAEAHEHLVHLERDMALIRELGSPRKYRRPLRSLGTSASGPTRSLAPVPLTVGQTATVNYNYNTCSVAASPVISARVVYVGSKTIVLEDNTSLLAGKIDADLIALATEFETVSFPLLLNFGDPLAFDSQTDANGRIIMLFTPKVNSQATNLLGFVQSCDFYPPSAAQSVSASNLAEIFYARAVTDTSPSSTSLNGRPQWKRNMPSVLIHEAKHITAFAERAADPLPAINEAVWLEEATAQMASEMYGRALHGNGWRTNASYFGTLDCEVRPATPGCGGGNVVMANHFLFLADFLQNFEQKTILSGSDDNDIYGSSWMFARWLTDTYGGADEGIFLRSIVKRVTTAGVINVTTPSGKSWPELLSQFTLMLATDDLAAISAPFTETSWNLPAVFKGYNDDLRNPPPAVPLTMRAASFGSAFTATVGSLRGGGAMLLKLTGTPGSSPQLLDLHAFNGSALPATSNIGMAVMRIQ